AKNIFFVLYGRLKGYRAKFSLNSSFSFSKLFSIHTELDSLRPPYAINLIRVVRTSSFFTAFKAFIIFSTEVNDFSNDLTPVCGILMRL
ncbi:MAG: hypothetical protein QXM06_04410, partial [Archaeoglobaceae archaeon]